MPLLHREVPADTTHSAEGSIDPGAWVPTLFSALARHRGTVLVASVFRDQTFGVG